MNSTFCKIAVIVTFLAHVATSRPQSQRTLVGGFIPIVSTGVRFPGEDNKAGSGSIQGPSYSAPHLYVAPIFDEFGDPLPTIIDNEIVNDDDEAQDDDYDDEIFDEAQEEDPKAKNLPDFQGVDLLKATEVLRSQDSNQESIVDPGPVNAGVLPLANDAAFEERYPPLFHP